MYLIRLPYSLPEHVSQSIITIGSFDGVHIGHQSLIQKTVAKAKASNSTSIAISFFPTPKAFFSKKPTSRVLPFRDQVIWMQSQSLDYFLCLRFNQELAKQTAEQFLASTLIGQLKMRSLIVGDDFAFGKNRQGSQALLTQLAPIYNFTMEKMNSIMFNNRRVSSGWVRETLAQGDFKLASQLLNRPYSITGRVGHGHARGSQLGFPTANLMLKDCILPMQGIFISETEVRGTKLPSVTYIGRNAIFGGETISVETHILRFYQNIYGEKISIIFHKKIRDDACFTSQETLVKHIRDDVAYTENFFSNHQNNTE